MFARTAPSLTASAQRKNSTPPANQGTTHNEKCHEGGYAPDQRRGERPQPSEVAAAVRANGFGFQEASSFFPLFPEGSVGQCRDVVNGVVSTS